MWELILCRQFGAEERGFDPAMQRFRKVRNHPGRDTSGASTGADEPGDTSAL
jgi:hypothetical protein